MHTSHVALQIPLLIKFYKEILHDKRVLKLKKIDIKLLQIAAIFHGFGRVSLSKDICRDSHFMEKLSQNTCFKYFTKNLKIPVEKAKEISSAITTKDRSTNSCFSKKSIYSEILQNSDCIAILRADDWEFNYKYLDLYKRINKQSQREKLFQYIDQNKKFLVSLKDPPYDMRFLAKKHSNQLIKGSFSLKEKEKFEKNNDCDKEMKQAFIPFFIST